MSNKTSAKRTPDNTHALPLAQQIHGELTNCGKISRRGYFLARRIIRIETHGFRGELTGKAAQGLAYIEVVTQEERTDEVRKFRVSVVDLGVV